MHKNKNINNNKEIHVYIGKDQFNGNRPFVDIRTVDYLPVSPWVSNFFTIHCSGKSFDTKRKYASQMKLILSYFKDHEIDIEERVYSGKFFTSSELEAFHSFCKFKSDSNLSNIINISAQKADKAIENAIHASMVSKSKARPHTIKGKLTRLHDFLKFMFTHVHADNMVPVEVLHRYNFAKDFLEDALTHHKDYDISCEGQGESALPTDVFLELMDIIKPNSPRNPFKRSKLRNFLMVQLYVETGNRRGDNAGLKISDMKFHGSFDEISIVKRRDDPEDTRTFIASTKTNGHLSSVSKSLMLDIQSYIEDVRPMYPRSQKHPFVFVSENDSKGTAGQPLSLSSINKVFSKLSMVLGYHVHCHLLRTKSNEVLSEIAEQEGLSFDETEKMRKYMMGWSLDSSMAEVYNRFAIFQKSKEYNALRQKKMTETKGNEKE